LEPLKVVGKTGKKSMKISNLDEYLQIEPLDDPAERDQLHVRFLHGVVVECDFPEWDVANRWCWQNCGPRHGECSSQPQYATCPVILPTERIEKTNWGGQQLELKRYSSVPVHHHVGIWTTYWFGKTDYDHGFGEFCFSNENDLAKFLEFVPQVDWGENYPWLKDEARE